MDISIINRVLIKIGEAPVASYKQAPYGDSLGFISEDLRKFLLSTYNWKFAVKRVDLAKSANEPLSGIFKYAYALPSDFLKLINVQETYKLPNQSKFVIVPDVRYSVEGNYILSSLDKITLQYVADEKDEAKFPSYFKEALITRIASEMSTRIKQSSSLKQLLESEFERIMMEARYQNQLLSDIETINDNSWVAIREGWHGDY